MENLHVSIEINGKQNHVGSISWESIEDACFIYDKSYLMSGAAAPVSIHLPLQEAPFSPDATKIFFDGLLPEGFTRKSVADSLRVNETHYLDILGALGRECLGAIRITSGNENDQSSGYRQLSQKDLNALALEGQTKVAQLVTKSHLSLTGASGKVGLYYSEPDHLWYQPLGCAPSTHIVKQRHIRLRDIIANEQLCMKTAFILGIDVPDSHMINTGDYKEEDMLFATRRYDRVFRPEGNDCLISGKPVPLRLHQEDFAQALGIASADKYEQKGQHYLKDMFDLIRLYLSKPLEDQLKLWDRIVFDYLIGNTDNHLKNRSFLYSEDLKHMSLAPAYDIISTAIYPASTRNMAFNVGGVYDIDSMDRSCFERACAEAGLSRKLALSRFDKMNGRINDALDQAADELIQEGFERAKLIKEKIKANAPCGFRRFI